MSGPCQLFGSEHGLNAFRRDSDWFFQGEGIFTGVLSLRFN